MFSFGVAEASVLLERGAASLDDRCPTFRESVTFRTLEHQTTMLLGTSHPLAWFHTATLQKN